MLPVIFWLLSNESWKFCIILQWSDSYGLMQNPFSNEWWTYIPYFILSIFYPKFPKVSTTCAVVNCIIPINLMFNTAYYGLSTTSVDLVQQTMSRMRFITCHVTASQMLLHMLYYQKHSIYMLSIYMIHIITALCATQIQLEIFNSKNG